MIPPWLFAWILVLAVTSPFVVGLWWMTRQCERAKRKRIEQWEAAQELRADGGRDE